ncbi:MAG: FHA domain-containing protein [Anaerolineales bacterium]
MASSSFRLIERTGPNPGETFELEKDVLTLGRDVTNDIVLADPEVSRQHARIKRTPGGYVLEDLGSTNGSFVNGERLVSPRVLNSGDLVGLGEDVTLTFEAAAAESAATVMAGPGQGQPQQPAEQRQPTPPAQAAAPPPPAAGEEEGEGRRTWLLAGCGCLLLLVVCVGVIWFMDAYYPEILYYPLTALGFGS